MAVRKVEVSLGSTTATMKSLLEVYDQALQTKKICRNSAIQQSEPTEYNCRATEQYTAAAKECEAAAFAIAPERQYDIAFCYHGSCPECHSCTGACAASSGSCKAEGSEVSPVGHT